MVDTRLRVVSVTIDWLRLFYCIVLLYECYGAFYHERCYGDAPWLAMPAFLIIYMVGITIFVLPAQLVRWLYDPRCEVTMWREMCLLHTDSYFNYGCATEEYMNKTKLFRHTNNSRQVIMGHVIYDRQFECTRLINAALLSFLILAIFALYLLKQRWRKYGRVAAFEENGTERVVAEGAGENDTEESREQHLHVQ